MLDSNGVPLDMGRATRTFTPDQYRAIMIRDGGASGPVSADLFAELRTTLASFPGIDPSDLPFQPIADRNEECGTDAYTNHYKDAVYLSDRAVGRLIEGVERRAAVDGRRHEPVDVA